MGTAAAIPRRRLRLLAFASALIPCALFLAGAAHGDSTDVSAPTTPTNITVSGVTTTSLGFVWAKSTDNVGVMGYDLYLNNVETGSTPSSFAAYFGLSCGQTYAFTVIAFDAAGNRSAPANGSGSTSPCAGGPMPTPTPTPTPTPNPNPPPSPNPNPPPTPTPTPTPPPAPQPTPTPAPPSSGSLFVAP